MNTKRVITIANHKGGVGKTTTVASLGVSLANLGYKVLLIDLDAQCNLTDIFLAETPDRTIYEALKEVRDLPQVKVREGLYITPSSVDLVSTDIELSQTRGGGDRLSKLIKGLEYDFILIDCPPSLGLLTANAFGASKEVIIPLTAEALPTKGLSTLISVINHVADNTNKDLRLSGILITRYNRRKINRLVEESLREAFGEIVYKTRIRENVDITESPLYGKDIYSYSPDSIGARDYLDLAKEISGRD